MDLNKLMFLGATMILSPMLFYNTSVNGSSVEDRHKEICNALNLVEEIWKEVVAREY